MDYTPRCEACGATHKLAYVLRLKSLLCKTCRTK